MDNAKDKIKFFSEEKGLWFGKGSSILMVISIVLFSMQVGKDLEIFGLVTVITVLLSIIFSCCGVFISIVAAIKNRSAKGLFSAFLLIIFILLFMALAVATLLTSVHNADAVCIMQM